MKRWRLSLLFLLPLVATPAIAQSISICEDLRARLADVPRIVGSSPEARKYSSAIAQQNLEIRKVENDLRRYGCSAGSIVNVDGEDAGFCHELYASLDRMHENIRYLIDMRNEAGRAGMDGGLRSQILASLEDNGCTTAAAMPDDPSYEDPYGSDRGAPHEPFISETSGYPAVDGYPHSQGAVTNISTVCVRTCDGGFFPLSSNATPDVFQRDADTCARMCPGVETELFYRFLGEQETADMVSVSTGAPYSAMPNAFIYRNRPPGQKSACACNLSAYYEEMRGAKGVPKGKQSSITRIETPPALESAPNPTAAQPSVATERPYDPAQRKVRQVGPQFLANDQGNIDLKNPAVTGPQPQQQ